MAVVMKFGAFDMDAELGRVSVSDVTKSELTDLGPGDRIAGYATHRYRIARAATQTTAFPHRTCKLKVEDVQEVWITSDPAAQAIWQSTERLMNGGLFGRSRGAAESWIDKFDALVKNLPKGVGLRTVATESSVGVDGKPFRVITTEEYTELSTTPIDLAVFAIPAGYRVEDLRSTPIPADTATAVVERLRGCDSTG